MGDVDFNNIIGQFFNPMLFSVQERHEEENTETRAPQRDNFSGCATYESSDPYDTSASDELPSAYRLGVEWALFFGEDDIAALFFGDETFLEEYLGENYSEEVAGIVAGIDDPEERARVQTLLVMALLITDATERDAEELKKEQEARQAASDQEESAELANSEAIGEQQRAEEQIRFQQQQMGIDQEIQMVMDIGSMNQDPIASLGTLISVTSSLKSSAALSLALGKIADLNAAAQYVIRLASQRGNSGPASAYSEVVSSAVAPPPALNSGTVQLTAIDNGGGVVSDAFGRAGEVRRGRQHGFTVQAEIAQVEAQLSGSINPVEQSGLRRRLADLRDNNPITSA